MTTETSTDVTAPAVQKTNFTQLFMNIIPDAGGLDLRRLVEGMLEKAPLSVRARFGVEASTDIIKDKLHDSMRQVGVPFNRAASILSDNRISEPEAVFILAKSGANLADKGAQARGISAESHQTLVDIVQKHHVALQALGMNQSEAIRGLAHLEGAVNMMPAYANLLSRIPNQELQKPGQSASDYSKELGSTMVDIVLKTQTGSLNGLNTDLRSAIHNTLGTMMPK